MSKAIEKPLWKCDQEFTWGHFGSLLCISNEIQKFLTQHVNPSYSIKVRDLVIEGIWGTYVSAVINLMQKVMIKQIYSSLPRTKIEENVNIQGVFQGKIYNESLLVAFPRTTLSINKPMKSVIKHTSRSLVIVAQPKQTLSFIRSDMAQFSYAGLNKTISMHVHHILWAHPHTPLHSPSLPLIFSPVLSQTVLFLLSYHMYMDFIHMHKAFGLKIKENMVFVVT